MKLVSVPAFLLALFLVSSVAYAQAEGRLVSITTDPGEIFVFQEAEIEVTSRNIVNDPTNYKLDLTVSSEGKIKSSNPFTFTLQPDADTSVSFSYVPDEVGEFEVLAKLFDETGLQLMDSMIHNFRVASEVGPFDVIIESPSTIVNPGSQTPLLLTLINMGQRATDVEVEVTMSCQTHDDIERTFFVFMDSESRVEKTVTMNTCNEFGLHEISASIILFDKKWIGSKNQVFLDEYTGNLNMEAPDFTQIEAGKSSVIGIKVTNLGNTQADNVKFVVSRVPENWVTIKPKIIPRIDPGGSGIFIVNITPPKNVPDSEVDVGLSAAADQVIQNKNMDLKVLSFSGEEESDGGIFSPPASEQSEPGEPPGIQLPAFSLDGTATYVAIGVVVGVGGLVAAVKFSGRRSYRKFKPTTLVKLPAAPTNYTSNRPENRTHKDFLRHMQTEDKLKKLGKALDRRAK